MFQIAVKKVNNASNDNKKDPIFTMAKAGAANKGDFSKYFDE